VQELKLTRAIRILTLQQQHVHQQDLDQLETISSSLMHLKVSVLNKHGGFPSHDVRQLHALLTTNMLHVRLVKLKQSVHALCERDYVLEQECEELETDMVMHLSWNALRPVRVVFVCFCLFLLFSLYL